MNHRMICYLLGVILMIEAGLLAIPALVAVIYAEWHSLLAFAVVIAGLLLVGFLMTRLKPAVTRIYAREGFICVAGAWLLMSAFGALPFVISGEIPNYINAFFETVSGFTTTGASILEEVETLSQSMLFWRSFTHWIGGMGVLVFVLAIMPSSDGRAIHLLRAEVPGPTKGKLVPKLRETAGILYGIYIFITVAGTVALMIAGLDLYDALVNTFGCVGTGGFSVKNAGIAAYGSPAVEWIMACLMLVCGINFNLYFFLLMRRWGEVFRNEELRVYLGLTAVSTALILWNTYNRFTSFSEAIRASFFQVTTVMSTAGFSTVDFDGWPNFSKGLLVLLMFTGACAGSTAGGFKLSRLMLIVKGAVRNIKQMLRPRSVSVVRMDGEVVDNETVRSANSYLGIYLLVFVFSVFLVSFDGRDFTTNFTGVLACFNNIGPGLSGVGPAKNFNGYSFFSKIILSLDMLFGRLEIMPMIILLSPRAWKR